MKLKFGWLILLPAVATVLPSERAEAQLKLYFGTYVTLGCTAYSGDVAKTVGIKNTTSATIPKARNLTWKMGDVDSGTVKLTADLAPGATVVGNGTAGAAQPCTAKFAAGVPDLSVASGAASGGSASAAVKNSNPWVGAVPSAVNFQVRRCSDQSLVTTVKAGPLAVPKGATVTFAAAVTIPATAGKTYVDVTADVDKSVLESNETNNLYGGMSSCIQ